MQNQQTYTPVNCWKCKAQNNAANSLVCRVCGCYLKREAETGISDYYTDSFTDYPAFRTFIWSSLVVVVVAAGLIYFYGRLFEPSQTRVAKENVQVDVPLPPDSWYRKSWWSYVSARPSVKQILEKNNEVSGKMLPPEIARTIFIKGKVSHAVGECFTWACQENRERRQAWFYERYPGSAPAILDGVKVPEKSDNWLENSYTEFGTIEVAAKIPDKSMRKAHVLYPTGSYMTADIIEVFNGQTGSKTTKFLDETGKVAKMEVETMDAAKTASTKAEMETLWKKNFIDNTDMQVRGIEKLGDRTIFAVTSKNKEGYPETHYFDSVTGYLIKMDLKEFTVYLDNYRPYEKARIPFTLYYRRPEPDGYHSWIRFEVAEWKVGDYIDDSVFESPGG